MADELISPQVRQFSGYPRRLALFYIQTISIRQKAAVRESPNVYRSGVNYGFKTPQDGFQRRILDVDVRSVRNSSQRLGSRTLISGLL
jgi:hypothetical protein